MFQVQVLQSWFMFWHFVLEVPTGVVADFFGRKRSVLIGLAFYGLGFLLYGIFPNFFAFLFFEFLLALGVALMSGADKALFFDSLKDIGEEKESKRYFGKALSWKLIGLAISAPVGSYIGGKFGLNIPMLVSSLSILVAFVFISRFKEPRRYEVEDQAKKYFDVFKNGIKFVWNNKAVRMLSFKGILVFASGYFIIWLYQPLLIKLDVPIMYFGYFHALLVFSQVIISNNFGFFEKKFGVNNYLKFSGIIVGLFFLIVAFVPNIFTAILFLIFAGGFGLTYMEFVQAHLNEEIPSNIRATILSTIGFFSSMFLFGANPIIGYLADHSVILAIGVVSFFPILALFIRKRK